MPHFPRPTDTIADIPEVNSADPNVGAQVVDSINAINTGTGIIEAWNNYQEELTSERGETLTVPSGVIRQGSTLTDAIATAEPPRSYDGYPRVCRGFNAPANQSAMSNTPVGTRMLGGFGIQTTDQILLNRSFNLNPIALSTTAAIHETLPIGGIQGVGFIGLYGLSNLDPVYIRWISRGSLLTITDADVGTGTNLQTNNIAISANINGTTNILGDDRGQRTVSGPTAITSETGYYVQDAVLMPSPSSTRDLHFTMRGSGLTAQDIEDMRVNGDPYAILDSGRASVRTETTISDDFGSSYTPAGTRGVWLNITGNSGILAHFEISNPGRGLANRPTTYKQ